MKGQDWIDWLRRDSIERRLGGLYLVIVAMIVMIFAYLGFCAYYLPERGMKILFGLAGFIALILTGPRFTFPLYFASWFGTGITLPGLPLSLNRVLAIAFVISWLISLYRKRVRLPNIAPVYLLALITIYAVVGGLLMKAHYAEPSINQLMYLLVGYAAASTYRERPHFSRLLWIMLAITCLINSVGLFEFIFRRDFFAGFSDNTLYEDNLRINGVAKNAIQFAFTSTWVLPWALLLHIESKTKAGKAWSLAGMLFLITLCLMTFNRQTPIILAAMFSMGLFLVRYKHRAVLLGVMCAIALAISPLVITKIATRVMNIGGEGRPDISLSVRVDKVVVAKDMISDYPWFGIGLNNFKDRWKSYTPPGELYRIHYDTDVTHYVDLGYLELLVETGIVGCILFIMLAISTFFVWQRGFHHASRLDDTFYRNAFAALFMGYVQLGLSMFLQDTFFIPRTYLLFGFLFAVIMMARVAARTNVQTGCERNQAKE